MTLATFNKTSCDDRFDEFRSSLLVSYYHVKDYLSNNYEKIDDTELDNLISLVEQLGAMLDKDQQTFKTIYSNRERG